VDLTALTDGATGWAGPLRNALTVLDTDKLGVTAASATYRPVLVLTGDEARPSVPTSVVVLWKGGSTEPTNMGVNDLWFATA